MNTTKRKTRTGRRSGVGTGTTSLLMIFTVLCFATLAMLSLSTASSSQRIQAEGLAKAKAVAAAKGEAATRVATLDAALLELKTTYSDYASIFEQLTDRMDDDTLPETEEVAATDNTAPSHTEAALELAVKHGWEVTDTGLIALRLPVDEGTELLTELRILPPGSAQRYEVVRQISRLIDGWTPSEDGQLWGGEG